ncbi:immunoglobulin-like domain-containing protein [Anaerofustis sp.]|uniref:immunoglobulin-like domain-containing protein n=1 Tax=Anaerofustis sp. TaxID=1872517 RepID=UPI0025BDACCB|nr:immunoglobulin-like domain-containing protein [Anaerofustis sp.]
MNLIKRLMVCLLVSAMVLSLIPQNALAKDEKASSLQYEVIQEISENKSESMISLKFTETEKVKLEKITLPDGTEKTEDLLNVTYTVFENGIYDFKVNYSMDGIEQDEAISVEVSEINEKISGEETVTVKESNQKSSLHVKNKANISSKKTIEANSWNELKTVIESASTNETVLISGKIEKSSTDSRIEIPSGVKITLVGTDVTFLRPSKSDVGEFYVGDNSQLILQGNYIIEAKNYEQGKGTLAHANFVEVSEKGTFSLDGILKANTSDGFFNGQYGVKGLIYCKGNMYISNKSSVSGWTIYDTTSMSDSRNAAVVLDGASANLIMDGGEITGNYNIGSNGVAGAAVQVHDGASFTMNDGSIHDNGIIDNPKNNVHYGSGVFVCGGNSSFNMKGGTIKNNNGMVGAGVYVYGSKNTKAYLDMTGGKIDYNNITNLGKYGCNGGGIYAKYADVKIVGKETEKISISNNGTTDFGTSYNSVQSSGGGIYVEQCTVNLNNIIIDNNTACGNNAQGGAGIWTEDSDVTINSGSISNNQGGKHNQNVYGGALRVEGSGTVTVENVTFDNNRVSPESDYQWNIGYGGAIMMNGEDTLNIKDCIIKNNQASGSGGGIYANQGLTEIRGRTVIKNNICNNNRTEWKSYLGEGICITSVATVKLYDQVMIDKSNTVGLEADKNGVGVITMSNSYTGIDKEHPVSIESMEQEVEQLPSDKGTPLVVFLDVAGGEKGAEYADENNHFIVSSYMSSSLHIGQSIENKNILTYVANRLPVIHAEDKTLFVGDKFNPYEGVSAEDAEDGDLTKEIEILKNEVNTDKAGVYEVVYKVTDSQGASETKTIKVTVKGEDTSSVPNKPNNHGSDKSSNTEIIKTGDHNYIRLYTLLFVMSIAGIVILTVWNKKENIKK